MFINKIKPIAIAVGIIIFNFNISFAQKLELISGNLATTDSTSGLAVEHFVNVVKERTNGRILITNYPAAQLGTGQEQIESIAIGTQHFFMSSGSAASSLIKSYSIIDMAFLFKDFDHFKRFMDSDMRDELHQKLIDDFGVRVLATNWYGMPRYLMHREKFILTADDVLNVRTRSPNLPMFLRNYQNMGATPVKVSYGEQYLALRQGIVEMTESAADRILVTKLYEVAPFITVADMMYPQDSVYVSEWIWQKISNEDKDIIEKAALETGEWATNLAIESFTQDKIEIEASGGKFMKMSESVRTELAAKAIKNITEMEEDGLIPRGWVEKIVELRDLPSDE